MGIQWFGAVDLDLGNKSGIGLERAEYGILFRPRIGITTNRVGKLPSRQTSGVSSDAKYLLLKLQKAELRRGIQCHKPKV